MGDPTQGTRWRVTGQDTRHTHIHTHPTPVQTHTQTKNREERQEYLASHSKTKTVTDSLNQSGGKILDLKANNSPLTSLQREPPTPLSLGSSGSNHRSKPAKHSLKNVASAGVPTPLFHQQPPDATLLCSHVVFKGWCFQAIFLQVFCLFCCLLACCFERGSPMAQADLELQLTTYSQE